MNIIISNGSSTPIYEQITTQIKTEIMNGTLKAGEPLPSMRALAKSLRISVITVQSAYEELQQDGFIQSVVGKGTFVSEHPPDFFLEEQRKEIEVQLQHVIRLAKTYGISRAQLEGLLGILYLESEDNE